RQSAPISYITASAWSADGGDHKVSLYFDISGEWAHGDTGQKINWKRETLAHQGGGNVTIQSFTPAAPTPLAEVTQYPSWGTVFLAAYAPSGLTSAIGTYTTVRDMGTKIGALDGSVDASMPRAINDQWMSLAFNFDLGQVGGTPTKPVTLLIGHARDPAI